MVFTMIAAVADMERALIRERCQAGFDRARRQGKKLGRPRALVDAEKIREEMAGGGSIRAVAKRWGVSRGVVRRLVATK
jgi:DNA invertase Pin-like site-specific DNA recombinase